MAQTPKNNSLLKPIFLLLLQLVALMGIFDVLSTNEQITETHHTQLLVSLLFIMISSVYTFKTLKNLKKEELNKEQHATF
ncbi:MAG: hypothetical protein K0U47_01745 [Epsilonproteobacteria bacterium]|nr:hypothetical protein [Campylobacterota bacterium]